MLDTLDDDMGSRNEDLIRFAAQAALCDRIRTIRDFSSIPMLVAESGDGAVREVSLGAFCLDAKTAALILREGWLARAEALAANFRAFAVRRWGVTEAELKQARKDYEAPSARSFETPPAAAPQDEGYFSADTFTDAMGPAPGVRP